MRKSSSSLIAATAAFFASGAASLAADYKPPIIIDNAPNLMPVEVGSAWYLRGDIGYNVSTEPRGDFTYRTFNGTSYGESAFSSGDLSDDFTFGIGIGYSFTDMLRADVTVDRFTASFNGATSVGVPCTATLPDGTGCRSEDASELTGYSAMLNGYVDLGTFVGFTPYFGGGVGYTYVSWDDLSSNYYCVNGSVACPSPALAGSATRGGESDWRFTYALMAGVAYDMSDRMKLDVGYRYKRIEGGDMFAWDTGSATDGATGVQGRDSGLSSHEVRVGLRLELW